MQCRLTTPLPDKDRGLKRPKNKKKNKRRKSDQSRRGKKKAKEQKECGKARGSIAIAYIFMKFKFFWEARSSI